MKKILILTVCMLFCISFPGTTRAQLPDGIEVKKIWDKADHNAFTDLIQFNGRFYCSFREGSGHVPGTDGEVRILSSVDGVEWEDLALLKKEGIDLRDPKLSITPSGQLMVIIGGSIYEDGKILGRNPYVSFSDEAGDVFSDPEKVSIDPEIVSWGDWIWRVTWHNGTGYAIDYQIGPEERNGPTALYLVKTTDGKHFTKVSKMEVDGFPNEATIRFHKDGSMYVMIRRELEDQMGVMAKSVAPFTEWEYQKMNIRIGGPNFIFDEDHRIIAATRLYEPEQYTGLLVGDSSGNFEKILQLPSGGDNSYPGMVTDKGILWLSYYSSHEDKSAIYLAKIPLSYFK